MTLSERCQERLAKREPAELIVAELGVKYGCPHVRAELRKLGVAVETPKPVPMPGRGHKRAKA